MDQRSRTVGRSNGRGPGFSRRSFVRYTLAGTGLLAAGGAIAVMANRPAVSPRQQGLPRIADWTASDVPSLVGRTALVTGGNGFPEGDRSGLGFHAALHLARAGADVVIASRRTDRGVEAIRQIRRDVPEASIRFERLDLSDLKSVTDFASRMRASSSSLDILINNAGVMARKARELSTDGFERVFATNVLGHFALSGLLLPLLQQASAPRVVWVSSLRSFGGSVNLTDLKGEADFDYSAAYDHSKLALLMIAFQMQARSAANGWGISAVAAHPGVARTNIIPDGPGEDSREGRNLKNMGFMFRPAAEAVLPILYAATSPEAVSGAYYGPGGMGELSGLPNWAGIPQKADDDVTASNLWKALEALSGVTFS